MKDLVVIVQESGLEATKANFILEKFKDYFEIASEWEKKAKTLIVTNADQTAEMQMARTGRLFLREKRIAIENARKELKEQSLREGKAIDGIASVLKALIVPIEEYLERQEKFVEIQQEEKNKTLRIMEENRRKIEEEQIAKEKAKKLAIENERLRKEAKERECKIAEEQAKIKALEEKTRKDREAQEKILCAQRETARIEQEKLRKEKEKIQNELRLKKEAEEKAKCEEEERIEALRIANDKTKLLNLAKDIRDIILPEVKSKKAKSLLNKVENLLNQAAELLKKEV